MKPFVRLAVASALMVGALPLSGAAAQPSTAPVRPSAPAPQLTDPVDPPARAARQSGVVRVLPPIAQNGPRAGSAAGSRTAGQVTFRPRRPGRPVVVQRRLPGGSWQQVSTSEQDRAGRVYFTARGPGRPWVYRAVAQPWRALSRQVAPVARVGDWRLRYREEFSGGRLDTDRWGYRDLGRYYGARTRSASLKRAVAVGGGRLQLKVVRHGFGRRGGERVRLFGNGHVGTKESYDFRYGIAAARIKFPRGRGHHGAFWLQPTSPAQRYGSPARTGAEIDVAEFFGKGYGKGGLAHFLHWYPREGQLASAGGVTARANAALKGRSDAWWKRYHVFSVEWTPTQYVFRIDGIETFRTSRGVSRQRQYLILSMLSSDWELPRLDVSTLPTQMDVDWLRVWQAPGRS